MPENVSRSRDADALNAAFAHEGCPVCTVVLERMLRVMDDWLYDGFTDVEHRFELIRSRGFCPLHTGQLAEMRSHFQLAVVYREVLAEVLSVMERYQEQNGQESSWRQWLRKRPAEAAQLEPAFDQCPLCKTRAEIEQRLIATLLEQLRSEEVRALFGQSTGLCLPHFNQVRQRASDPEALRHLLTCQQTCMQRVLDEVQELVRKHDYRFSDEPQGEAMSSWRRAVLLLVGNPGVR